MESTSNSSISGNRKASKKTVASSATAKPNGKSPVSSSNPMNPNTVTALSSAHANQVMFFRDVSLGPREAELRFRLIHLWEARNICTKTLIGQEMLLIDEEGTVIQGFVPAGQVGTFDLVAGSVYKLNNFFGSRNKAQFSVADHIAIVSFSWNSDLSVLENPPVLIPEDRFRFHSFEEFMANCDSKGDLYAGADHCVPVLQALLDTIGQTRKFIVKVSDHNLKGKTQTITVTKIFPPEAPLPATSDDIPTTRGDGSAPSSSFGDPAGDRARKAADNLESDDAKRSKSG
ncbi:hypothetical protein YC2023_040786 [Brassica napus]